MQNRRLDLSEITAHVRELAPTFREACTSVLFIGPAGTGKTLAASALAAELGLHLYRVDLSRLVSKYIGDTEKNLDHVFKEAEEANAILFIDEADALFGKRSEVKDAHDRYANAVINYLLQRIEEHHGLAILTTNSQTELDPALLRRFRFVVHFPPRAKPTLSASSRKSRS